MFRTAIVCMSDKGARGEREDLSTKVIEKIVTEKGYKIVKKILIPDEQDLLKEM